MNLDGDPAASQRAPRNRRARLAGGVVIVIVLATMPWWGRRVLSELAFFRVRKIEIYGLHYLAATDLKARLGIDTTESIWTDLTPLEERAAKHPQVAEISIHRRLPGTLVVRVTEHLPVALVPTRAGFEVLDARGMVLPVDPSGTRVNLPILAQRDTALLRLLSAVRTAHPAIFERISEARRTGSEVRLLLADVTVLAMSDVTVQRLADILPVERDLATKQLRAAELDLRYRERVIARLP